MFIERPPLFYRMLFPETIWRLPCKEKTIYLTFDDGPVPEITPWVLNLLDYYDVKATFFCVGENVARNTELYAEILKRGHHTGNHTMNHIQGMKYSIKDYVRNVDAANELIHSALFRPPHGHMCFGQAHELRQKYKTFASFNERFEIDDEFLTQVRALADKEKIGFDEEQYRRSLPLIRTQLKALIARDLWDMNEYYQVMNATNESVRQALHVLNEGKYDQVLGISD